MVRRGKLHPIPEGFLLLAPTRILPFVTSRLFSWPGKIRMGFDVILPAKQRPPDGDESLADFVRRRFGREALERIAQPLVGGIYTADPEKLSLRTTMPRFLEAEDKYRSVILGMRARRKAMAAHTKGDSGARYSMFVSFDEGMATLTDTLISRLPPDAARTDVAVSKVERAGARWRVVLADGSAELADAVILACPSYASSRMVEGVDPALAGELNAIKYASSATMTMAFQRDQIRHALDGFGFVVPSVENRSMIAGTFGSIKFAGRAPNGWVLMRTFLGGAIQPHVYEMDDQDSPQGGAQGPRRADRSTGRASLHRDPPLAAVHRRSTRSAIWTGSNASINGWLVCPVWRSRATRSAGVGIPDCVQSGEQAADGILKVMSTE